MTSESDENRSNLIYSKNISNSIQFVEFLAFVHLRDKYYSYLLLSRAGEVIEISNNFKISFVRSTKSI